MRVFVVLLILFSIARAVETDSARNAIVAFRGEKYREAAALFAEAPALTAEQQTAWAYCRLRLAAEDWNASRGDAAVGKRVIAEVSEALTLVPDHAELQKFGRDVIVAAGGQPPVIVKPKTETTATGWFSLESANFRVRYPAAAKDLAATLSMKAEEQRAGIFTRWSGPAGGDWTAKCEIVVHPSATDFAHATGQPAAATGHALVQMVGGKPALRRIDLRSDDDTAAIDALPRELTHIILSDLFPTTPPPRWAADGMSILAMSPAMVERYLKTAATREWTASNLMTATTVSDVTLHAVGSAALVEYLVKLKGGQSVTLFLRDIQRYGLEKCVERQFSFATLTALDKAVSDASKKRE